jgi:hypothetical protein
MKTIATHTVTYFFVGLLVFKIFDYPRLFEETGFRFLMRPTTDPLVKAGILFQPIRGILLGIAFIILKQSFFTQDNGWFLMWISLLCLSVLGTFGPTLASIEGMVYTKIPLRIQLIGLPEILVQSFLLSFIVFHWVRNPEAQWINLTMWTLFILALTVSLLGFFTKRPK